MEIRIKETNEVMELAIYDKNGIEWTADLMGGFDELKYNTETEEYEMTKENYEWWQEYIANYTKDAEETEELAQDLGIDEQVIWDRVNSYHTCDYGDHHAIKQAVLQSFKKGKKEEWIIELFEKEILTLEELEELLEHDQILEWNNNGNSGKHYGYIWYTCTFIDGEEYSVYAKSEG